MAWLGDYMTENSLENLAVITGPAGLVAEVEQQKGFQEALNEYPNLKVVATASGDWDTAKIKTAFANAYAAHPDIQGVWLSFGCGEVWQVLQAAGKPMIPCTGGGVNEERTMMLPPEQGGISAPMTSLVSSTATGELAFILAVKALSGESVAQNTILPNPALTAEQLKMGTNPAEGANVYPASDVPAGFWPDIWNPLVEQGLEAALNGTPDKVSTAKPCSEVPGCTETAT
jgi:ABC-type sugar transport system substrate-binding protein